jgi:Tfp pilus assembly protein PilF
VVLYCRRWQVTDAEISLEKKMKTRRKFFTIACCITLLSGCATNKSVGLNPWWITPVTKNSSDNPEAMYQLGRYYQGQNRFDLAIASYQRALDADSSYVEAHNGMGIIYSKQKRYDEAIHEFKLAIQLDPRSAHTFNNLGYVYILQGQYSASIEALEQAIKLDPTNQNTFKNLTLANARSGNSAESTQAFAQEAMNPNLTINNTLQNISSIPIDEVKANLAPMNKSDAKTVLGVDLEKTILHKESEIKIPSINISMIPVVNSHVTLELVAPRVYVLHQEQDKPLLIKLAIQKEAINSEKWGVEVANGNGMMGMASKVGQFLHEQGYPIVKLANQKPYRTHKTQIQYRQGYLTEAEYLKSNLPESPELVQRNDMRNGIGVRLVLGWDYVVQLSNFDNKSQKLKLALNLK